MKFNINEDQNRVAGDRWQTHSVKLNERSGDMIRAAIVIDVIFIGKHS